MKDLREIFKGCLKKDSRAQRDLYDLYKSRLFGICRRYTRNRDEAYDILQETFIKIFKSIDNLQEYEKLESWIKKIAVNTAINYYRRSKSFEDLEQQSLMVVNNDYEKIFSNLSEEVILNLINALPDGCRIVFNMYIIEGLQHSEIAEMLKVSEATSRSQLHHAKLLLKKKLESIGIKNFERYAGT
jgi:RNA polymerase sigma factor (sigma-70 family)